MWTAAFWKALAERAIKTFAQSLAALLVADGADILSMNWGEALSVAGMAAVVSVLTTIASGAITGGEASVIKAETVTEPTNYTPRHAAETIPLTGEKWTGKGPGSGG